MIKSFHSSKKTAEDIKKKILKTKAENILSRANRNIGEGIEKSMITSDRAADIAGFNANNIDDFTENVFNSKSLSIFKGGKVQGQQGYVSDETVSKPILESLHKNNFFKNLQTLGDLKKTQSGSELMSKNVIAASELMTGDINYNYSSALGAIDAKTTHDGFKRLQDIKKKGGTIINFDIESLGGTNAAGHQQIDHITEISAIAFDVQPGKEDKIVEEMTTMFGFSEEEFNKTNSYLQKLKSTPKSKYTSKDNVYLNRLSRAADSNIKYDFTDGFDIQILDTSNAISEKDLVTSVDEALKGANQLRKFGVHQESFLKTQGITGPQALANYKKAYVKDVQEFVLNGVGKKQTYKDALVTGHNISTFDMPQMARISGHNINNPVNAILDTFNAVKIGEEVNGQGAFHNNVSASKISELTKKHGSGTQDFFRALYNVGDGQAHNARIDVLNNFELLMKSDFGTNLERNLVEANKAMEGLKGGYKQQDRVGIFYNPKTPSVGYGNKDNALSFIYDPLDDSFMSYNGYKVDNASGKVTSGDFNGWGGKAHGLYEKKVYNVDLTKDWKESFKQMGMSEESADSFYQQYAGLDNIKIIESREFIDKEKLAKQVGKDGAAIHEYGGGKVYYDVITNKEHLATSLGAKVGYKNVDGSFAPKADAIEALGLQKMAKDAEGNITVQNLSMEDAVDQMIDRSTRRTAVDSSARTIRESSYSRLQSQRLFGISNARDGQRLKMSQVIAEQIAANKDLTMDITTPMIQELGWGSGDKRKIVPERLAKASMIDEYIENGENIFAAMEKIFAEQGLADNYDIRETSKKLKVFDKVKNNSDHYGKKDFIFNKTIQNALEDISNDPSLISGSSATIMTKFEANKVDFDTFDIFPELSSKRLRGTVANKSQDIASIDLNDNDGLIRAFKSGPNDSDFNSLVHAYKTIEEDPRFKNVWKGISLQDVEAHREGNLSIINDKMMENLRLFTNKQRKDNSGFGYKFVRTAQDPLKQFDLLAGMDSKKLEDLLRKNYANVDNYTNASTASKSPDIINDIVNKYFMTFSEEDLEGQIKGLTAKQQNVMRSNYSLAKKDANKRVTELIKASGGNTGIDLIMSGEGKETSLFFNRGQDIRKLDVYKYTLNNGVIEAKIGNNHHAVGSAYNTSTMVKNGRATNNTHYGKLDISVTNAIENAMDHSSDLSEVVDRAIEGERDILDDLIYNINSKRNMTLREVLPMREANNYNNTIQRAMKVDYNGLISILPELDDARIIDDIIARGGMSEEYATMFKESVDKMRKSKNKRIRNLDEMVSLDKALYLQLFDEHITDLVNPHVSFDDNKTEEAFRHIANYTKRTGEKTLDTTPAPHGAARFDKDSRPPVYQYGNTELYNKEVMRKGLNKAKAEAKAINGKSKVLDNVFNKNLITTAAGEQFIYNVNGTHTSGLTLKYLQMDSNTLRNSILENNSKKSSDIKFNKIFGEGASDTLTNKARGLNTYEQQTLMNSRVFDVGFNKTNRQSISAKKKLLITHANNVKLIQEMNTDVDKLYPKLINGKIEYTPGIDVSTNQVLGQFGDEANPEVIRAKFDGLFRTRYYKNGEMVSENELNKFIGGLKLKISDPDYNKKVISAINKSFDQKSEVINKFQTYGQKAFNDTMEKSTVETLAMSMGSMDKEMFEYLEKNDKDLLGKVLSKDYEEEVLKKYKGKMVGKDSFSKRYFREKHAFSDYLSSLNQFEDVSQIVALDTFKHQSSSMSITNGLQNLQKDKFLENDKVINTLFGYGKWSRTEEGKIRFDDIKSINIGGLRNSEDEVLRAAGASFDRYDEFTDGAGDAIGHKGYSHVVQVRDDSAGTYSGRFLKDSVESGATDSYKGVKFSKNMNTTLSAMKYDKDSISLAKKRYTELGMEDEFQKAFGHALDSEGAIKEEFLGKSMLDPVTERSRSLLRMTPGEKLLSEYKGDSRYSHLMEEFGDKANTVSIDRAENAYSYAQGERAIEFNKKYTRSEHLKLTEKMPDHLKFTEVDLTKAKPGSPEDWLPLDIGGQGNTVTGAKNNPYTNNIMIKYGEKSSDVLAIPRMPEAHFDDSVIKVDHIKKLNQLQNQMQQMNNVSGSRKDQLREQVESTVEEIKALQKKDITSKTGLAGEMQSVRMDQSFFGKASGLVYNDTERTSLRNSAKYNSVETFERLVGKNEKALSEAMYNGKSLMQHYSEGKAIDSVFLSEDAFKKMGYFDEDFMKDIFKNMDSSFEGGKYSKVLEEGNIKTSMMDLLSIHGDSFIGVRYPEIMEGSDTMVRGYLSKGLKGNQIQAIGHTGAKMRLDHDGDNLAVSRAQTVNGKSTLNYLTNAKGSDQALIDLATAIDASMMQKAVNDNWYWDDEVRGRVQKEFEIANMSKLDGKQMIDAVGKEKMIDGKLISSMLDSENTTTGEYSRFNQDYSTELKMTAANDGDHSKAVELIKSQNRSVDDYAKGFAFQAYRDENTAKAANQSIGEINSTNAKIKMAFSSVLDNTDENSKYYKTTAYDLFHISEEAAISAKSSIEGLDPDRAKNWNTMATKLLSGEGNVEQRNELASGMKEWANEYTVKDMRLNQYWDESEVFQNKVKNTLGNEDLTFSEFKALMADKADTTSRTKVTNMVVNDFVENLQAVGEVGNMAKLMKQLAIGQSRNGVLPNSAQHYSFGDVKSNADEAFDLIQDMQSSAKDFENIHSVEKATRNTFSSGSGVDNIISSAERNTSKKSISHAILEGTGDFFKGARSSGLAIGALGIAASIMAVGFVGGRPRPADVHAMEEAQETQMPMNGHSSLADPGLGFSQGGGNGYVVNINARTDKGRDHAVSAIQEAISSGTSSNINVSMNINDNYGNMNNRDLEKAFADVFR